MNNINSSNYYRANPYKDIGYMPPIAQKNRTSPQYGTQLPQGQQYFEHATKKHYQFAYKNQIENDHIMKGVDKFTPIEQQALQRSYFRSLNAKDIEGSSTNTLISKAVKNKLKAQVQLQRRKDMERQEEQILRQERQKDQINRRKWVEQYHRQVVAANRGQQNQQASTYNTNNNNNNNNNNKSFQGYSQNLKKSPNNTNNNNNQLLTQTQKRKKRQQQLLRIAQQRKNYAIVDFGTLYDNYKKEKSVLGQNETNKVAIQSLPNFHQIQQERKRIKQEREREGKDSKERELSMMYNNNNGYNGQPKYQSYNEKNNPYQQNYNNKNQYDNNNNYNPKYQNYPNPNSNSNYNNQNNNNNNYNNNSNYNNYNNNYNYKQQQNIPYPNPPSRERSYSYNTVEKDQMRKLNNYDLPNYKIQPITQINNQRKYNNNNNNNNNNNDNEYNNLHTETSQYTKSPNTHQKNLYPNPYPQPQNTNTNPPDIYQNLYNSQASQTNPNNIKVPAFKNRQQLRRHNPTYLSYQSPTFALASKNIIGY